jgi:hypothetical protein
MQIKALLGAYMSNDSRIVELSLQFHSLLQNKASLLPIIANGKNRKTKTNNSINEEKIKIVKGLLLDIELAIDFKSIQGLRKKVIGYVAKSNDPELKQLECQLYNLITLKASQYLTL